MEKNPEKSFQRKMQIQIDFGASSGKLVTALCKICENVSKEIKHFKKNKFWSKAEFLIFRQKYPN